MWAIEYCLKTETLSGQFKTNFGFKISMVAVWPLSQFNKSFAYIYAIVTKLREEMAKTNYQILIEMRDSILEYLEEEKTINEKALLAYEPKPIAEQDAEIRILREKEAIKLRDRITELSRHIAVIKRMYPNT